MATTKAETMGATFPSPSYPSYPPQSPDRPPQLQLAKPHHYAWFNPHHLHFTDADGNDVEWQSRRQRKRRYPPAQYEMEHNGQVVQPYLRVPDQSREHRFKPHLLGDISFWEALSFTVGSVIWVINGFLAWLPFLDPDKGTEKVETAAASLGFIGGLIFEIGAYLMVVEALDRGREHAFGTALGNLLDAHRLEKRLEHELRRKWKMNVYKHDPPTGREHSTRADDYSRMGSASASGTQAHVPYDPGPGDRHEYPHGVKGWVWWCPPRWHDIGYCAALIMFVSATIFWIPTLVGLPGVIPGMSEGRHVVIVDIFYWSTQVIGSVGFVISSFLLLLEVQHHWWEPRPFDIGWQVGLWNVIGSVGFLLCAAFGYSSSHGMKYQSALSTFWGSCAFLLGSACQLWEIAMRVPPPKNNKTASGSSKA